MLSEPGLLAASSSELVGAMVTLVAAFPARDVQAMVQARPGLLLLQVRHSAGSS